jgi:hypothetical protein
MLSGCNDDQPSSYYKKKKIGAVILANGQNGISMAIDIANYALEKISGQE